MPFDSNGTFNRVIPGGWKADALAGIKIRADRHDDEDDGFATGLSTCITKDGRTQPTANIPMNNKKFTNLGDPDNPQDAATKNYVDNFKTFTTGATISGAGPINGFIHFSAPTGVNGIGWTTADMSWIGRLEEAGKTAKRLAVNNKEDGTGSDVCIVDENGYINYGGHLMSNGSLEGGQWRTIVPGHISLMTQMSGNFNFYSNDTATTAAYQPSGMRNFATLANSAGTTQLTLNFAGSAKSANFLGNNNGVARWLLRLGNGEAEAAANAGSNFDIHRYANDGSYLGAGMNINRATGDVNFYGTLNAAGKLSTNGYFSSNTQTAILSAQPGGAVYLRPNGQDSGVGQVFVGGGGNIDITAPALMRAGAGYNTRAGATGGYGVNVFNFLWDGTYVRSYIDAQYVGAIMWQCDYRIKKGIKPLPSTWDAIKALNPVRYTQKAYKIWVKDDTERWGFLAHELQETLGKNAATGEKDGEDIQSPNLLAIVAGLTKALQEAMARIEALEARA